MTTRHSENRRNENRAGSDELRLLEIAAALRRIWTAVKERVIGPRPSRVPVPVRVRVRR